MVLLLIREVPRPAIMNSDLHLWWGKERMRQMHEEAAKRALVRSLRRPLALALADILIRLGGYVARIGSDPRRHEQLPAAVNRILDARHEQGDPVYFSPSGVPREGRLTGSDTRRVPHDSRLCR